MIKRADSARGAPGPLRFLVAWTSNRSHGRILGPAVHLVSLSAVGKAYPDRDRSRHSSSIAIRCQEGVSGPRVVQPSIFTRYPRPGRRIRAASCPGVYRHSLSAARKAYPDPDWSSRSTSLAIHRREGVSAPRVVQPFIFTRSGHLNMHWVLHPSAAYCSPVVTHLG